MFNNLKKEVFMNSLVKKNGQLTSSMPSLLNDFFADDLFRLPLMQWRSGGATLPSVNIKETPDAFHIQVAAPGMKREDFKVELDHNTLSISCDRQQQGEENDQEGNYVRREFSYEAFERTFTLPGDQVEGDKIQARYIEGILQINVPKKEQFRRKPARQIKVA
jgi:HSP20 family protein